MGSPSRRPTSTRSARGRGCRGGSADQSPVGHAGHARSDRRYPEQQTFALARAVGGLLQEAPGANFDLLTVAAGAHVRGVRQAAVLGAAEALGPPGLDLPGDAGQKRESVRAAVTRLVQPVRETTQDSRRSGRLWGNGRSSGGPCMVGDVEPGPVPAATSAATARTDATIGVAAMAATMATSTHTTARVMAGAGVLIGKHLTYEPDRM